ncbi:MAG: PAS domain-containing protein [Armatimonadetes bacterium]|nr:PAS domain-containing protein [Armatimonadota bacterium]
MPLPIPTDILEALHESAVILSPTGTVKKANRAFCATFALSPDAVRERPLWELGAGFNDAGWRELLDTVPHEPGATVHDATVTQTLPGDSARHTLRVNAQRLMEASGDADGFLLVIDDTTARIHFAVENARLQQMSDAAAAERGIILRDVLAAATEDKLHLCLSPSDLPPRPTQCEAPFALSKPTLHGFRKEARRCAEDIGMETSRIDDFENAVGESAMNAVVHSGAGIGEIWHTPTGTVQAWIFDNGTGIPVADLPRALLQTGFSSRGTLGQGFRIILQSVDRLFIWSSPTGTVIVLEQEKTAPLPQYLFDLADFDL